MDRPRSHEIDDQAIAIFRTIKPVELVVNDLHPDYAKDYLVEIAEGKKMTGEPAIVQLKGQEALASLKDGKSFYAQAETRDLFCGQGETSCIPRPVIPGGKRAPVVGVWRAPGANKEETIPFAVGHNDMSAHLLGQDYPLGEVDIETTRVDISKDEKENVKKRLARDRFGPIAVMCLTAPDCELVIRRPQSGA